tara:strand:- start:52 stop:591 length:540 start_codon:yes stop_codon:yes gene_type:complete
MQFSRLEIPDVILITPNVFGDARGYFFEVFHEDKFSINFTTKEYTPKFVQDNQAFSTKGVVRGLHFQNKYPQGKLVRCIKGSILDVAVDIRPDSPTFGHHVSAVLSEHNHNQLWVPRGFAHGYSSLGDENIVLYKCDDFYHPEDEGGIKWDDPSLNIDWNISSPIVSDKDMLLPSLLEL